MFWRDFFYFSKGERTGLIVLLSIIVTAITLLYITNRPEPVDKQNSNEASSNQNVAERILSTEAATPENEINSVATNNPSESTMSATKTTNTTTATSSSRSARETVPERVNRLTSYSQPAYVRAEKFTEGTIVELNTADTTTLKKVPGIGSAFAKRIVGYRALLGGYYTVTQLAEVYGMDDERYAALQPWFTVDPSHIHVIAINKIPQDSLQRHPYISYAQARVIIRLRNQKGKLTGWENLQLLNEFTDQDKSRLQPYLSFE